jgi:hypothetical protein
VAKVEDIGPYVEPVRKSVTVKRTPAEAFEIFTARFGAWWPVKKFSLHQDATETAVIEPRVGGAIYEIAANGERAPWGHVKVWEPGARFVMAWHPGHDAAEAQEVEIRFVPDGDGTRVELEHRDWQGLGAKAAQTRENYDQGWVFVFEQCYREACS